MALVTGEVLNQARRQECRCSFERLKPTANGVTLYEQTFVKGCPVHDAAAPMAEAGSGAGHDACLSPGGDCAHGVPGHLLCGACELDVADGLNVVLAERGSRYGAFPPNARISQALKQVMADTPNWLKLYDWQRESLELIALKVSRILSGDPTYADNWVDMAGYAQLVVDELARRSFPAAPGGLSCPQADAAEIQS